LFRGCNIRSVVICLSPFKIIMPSSSLTPPPHHSALNRVETNGSDDAMDVDDDELAQMECEEEEERVRMEEARKCWRKGQERLQRQKL
jgi:DNA primase catalytic subunit